MLWAGYGPKYSRIAGQTFTVHGCNTPYLYMYYTANSIEQSSPHRITHHLLTKSSPHKTENRNALVNRTSTHLSEVHTVVSLCVPIVFRVTGVGRLLEAFWKRRQHFFCSRLERNGPKTTTELISAIKSLPRSGGAGGARYAPDGHGTLLAPRSFYSSAGQGARLSPYPM